jgi:hypothetical protein
MQTTYLTNGVQLSGIRPLPETVSKGRWGRLAGTDQHGFAWFSAPAFNPQTECSLCGENTANGWINADREHVCDDCVRFPCKTETRGF